MEYTVLGDSVNLSARLMSNAEELKILTDEETSRRTTGEVVYTKLAPIKVKGKANAIAIFQPKVKGAAQFIGLTPEPKIRFPWYHYPMDGSDITKEDVVGAAKSKIVHLCSLTKWPGIVQVQEMLGGKFNKDYHRQDVKIGSGGALDRQASAPKGPFLDGGVVVLQGDMGMGKIELAEHMAMHAAIQFQM